MRWRGLYLLVLFASAFLLALHFVHLKADFPNHSPWVDWAKYTDEGWYGDAAIRHYLLGTWHLPGDFNPAAALPVWPLLEAAVFRFTGVGIVAARVLVVSVFALILAAGYRLLLRPTGIGVDASSGRHLWAATAVLLLTANPFVYAFSRMAILEPLLILLTLLALLTAAGLAGEGGSRRSAATAVLLGVLITLMIGTKTTAIFLLPSVMWMLGSSLRWQRRALLRAGLITAAITGVLWFSYLVLIVRSHLLEDFRYLFTANQYTGIQMLGLTTTIWETLKNGTWLGWLLYSAFFLILVLSLIYRSLWRDPVFTALALWIVGYLSFLAYHANFQPRYYLVLAIPVTLLIVRASASLAGLRPLPFRYILPLLFAAIVLLDARETIRYVRHPEYTFLNAAAQVERVVESEPNHSHVVLSISGSDLSLMTGLPSICDDFGTMDLEDRIAAYHPGWFIAWNMVEDDKMEALARFYRLTRIAAFPAMDDPDRNLLIVYRLNPKEGVHPRRRRNRLPRAAARGSDRASLAAPHRHGAGIAAHLSDNFG